MVVQWVLGSRVVLFGPGVDWLIGPLLSYFFRWLVAVAFVAELLCWATCHTLVVNSRSGLRLYLKTVNLCAFIYVYIYILNPSIQILLLLFTKEHKNHTKCPWNLYQAAAVTPRVILLCHGVVCWWRQAPKSGRSHGWVLIFWRTPPALCTVVVDVFIYIYIDIYTVWPIFSLPDWMNTWRKNRDMIVLRNCLFNSLFVYIAVIVWSAEL